MKDRNFTVWENILQGRKEYYVEYCPARTDFPHAVLNVIFPYSVSIEKVAEILESEFREWALTYNVPLSAFAWDKKEDRIYLSSIRSGDSINGFYDPYQNS